MTLHINITSYLFFTLQMCNKALPLLLHLELIVLFLQSWSTLLYMNLRMQRNCQEFETEHPQFLQLPMAILKRPLLLLHQPKKYNWNQKEAKR